MMSGVSYRKLVGFFLMLIISAQQTYAQDLHFSQFFEAPLLRNPSLAGIFTGDYRIQGVYRDQWNSITNGYRTGSFNGEYKMPVGNSNDFITTGLQVLYDKAGTVALTATDILPVLNYHKSLSAERNMYLSAGFSAGIVQRKIEVGGFRRDIDLQLLTFGGYPGHKKLPELVL